MDRRLFLKLTSSIFASTAGSSLFLPNRVWANNEDHFFVLIQVNNGWDVTLSLDPKVHQEGHSQKDMFIEYQADEIIEAGELHFGPAFQSMIKHSQDLHIIRGIEMRRDAGHSTNREIISSGYGDGRSALIPVELSASTRSGPLGVLIENSIPTGARNTILTELRSVANSSSLEGMLSTTPLIDDSTFAQALAGLQLVNGKMDLINEKVEELTAMGITDENTRALIASFLAQAAYQGSLNIDAELDTHTSHEGSHLSAQSQAWSEVSEMFDAFKMVEYSEGESLFDRTTFMVVSEFARTSALNSSAGKDHNPHANSVLLAGRGVQGGRSSGESFVIGVENSQYGVAEHISYPINYSTGEVVRRASSAGESVNLIFPENVSATVGAIFGSPMDYYSNQTPASVIPSVIKT